LQARAVIAAWRPEENGHALGFLLLFLALLLGCGGIGGLLLRGLGFVFLALFGSRQTLFVGGFFAREPLLLCGVAFGALGIGSLPLFSRCLLFGGGAGLAGGTIGCLARVGFFAIAVVAAPVFGDPFVYVGLALLLGGDAVACTLCLLGIGEAALRLAIEFAAYLITLPFVLEPFLLGRRRAVGT
jgi:hypothetical protein